MPVISLKTIQPSQLSEAWELYVFSSHHSASICNLACERAPYVYEKERGIAGERQSSSRSDLGRRLRVIDFLDNRQTMWLLVLQTGCWHDLVRSTIARSLCHSTVLFHLYNFYSPRAVRNWTQVRIIDHHYVGRGSYIVSCETSCRMMKTWSNLGL